MHELADFSIDVMVVLVSQLSFKDHIALEKTCKKMRTLMRHERLLLVRLSLLFGNTLIPISSTEGIATKFFEKLQSKIESLPLLQEKSFLVPHTVYDHKLIGGLYSALFISEEDHNDEDDEDDEDENVHSSTLIGLLQNRQVNYYTGFCNDKHRWKLHQNFPKNHLCHDFNLIFAGNNSQAFSATSMRVTSVSHGWTSPCENLAIFFGRDPVIDATLRARWHAMTVNSLDENWVPLGVSKYNDVAKIHYSVEYSDSDEKDSLQVYQNLKPSEFSPNLVVFGLGEGGFTVIFKQSVLARSMHVLLLNTKGGCFASSRYDETDYGCCCDLRTLSLTGTLIPTELMPAIPIQVCGITLATGELDW